jgi:hypothetical protein
MLLGAGLVINCKEPTFFIVSREAFVNCHWLHDMPHNNDRERTSGHDRTASQLGLDADENFPANTLR